MHQLFVSNSVASPAKLENEPSPPGIYKATVLSISLMLAQVKLEIGPNFSTICVKSLI